MRIVKPFALAVLVLTIVGAGYMWKDAKRQRALAALEVLAVRYDSGAPLTPIIPGSGDFIAIAITSIARAAISDPSYRAVLEYLQDGHPAEAASLLQDIANTGPPIPERFRTLGAIAGLTDIGRARLAYAKAAELDPDNPDGLFCLAWLELHAQDTGAASRDFLHLLTGNAGAREIFWARIGLGDIANARGRSAEALADYTTAQRLLNTQIAKSPGQNTAAEHDLLLSTLRIGDVLTAWQSLPGALTSYRDSLGIVSKLLETFPTAVLWRRERALTLDRIGDVLKAQGHWAEALTAYRESLSIRTALNNAAPQAVALQQDVSRSHEAIGDLQARQGAWADAAQSFRASLDVRVAADPSAQRDLAIVTGKHADALFHENQPAEALKSYQDAIALLDGLATSVLPDAGAQRDLAVMYNQIADTVGRQGPIQEASKLYVAALSIAARLTELDPGNATWARDLSVSYDRVGDILAKQAHWPDALRVYRAGLDVRKTLASADFGSSNRSLEYDVSVSLDRIGEALLAQGALPDALASFRASLAIQNRLVGAEPNHPDWRRSLALTRGREAAVLDRQGDRPAAVAAFQKGRALLLPLSDSTVTAADLAWFDERLKALEP